MVNLNTGFNEADAQFFAKNFTVLQSNVDRLQDATLICIADKRYWLSVATKNSWLIEKITDVFTTAYAILVEGTNRGEKLSEAPLQAPFISSRHTVKGWDDAQEREKTEKLKNELCEQLASLRQIAKPDTIDSCRLYDSYLKPMLDSLPDGKMKTAACQDWQDTLGSTLAPDRKKMHNIFNSILKLKILQLAHSVIDGIKARNQSCVVAQHDELKDSKKVISLIGKGLLFQDEDKKSRKKAEDLEIIKTFLGQHKYVILEANENVESVDTVRKELEIKQAGGTGWYIIQKIKDFALAIFKYIKNLVQPIKNLIHPVTRLDRVKQYKELTLGDLKEECYKFLEEFKQQNKLG